MFHEVHPWSGVRSVRPEGRKPSRELSEVGERVKHKKSVKQRHASLTLVGTEELHMETACGQQDDSEVSHSGACGCAFEGFGKESYSGISKLCCLTEHRH